MPTTLFGINNCDTIKRTKKWLDAHSIEYEFHDYKKLGCSKQLIQQFMGYFDHEQLINRRGTTWRKLPESVKNSLDASSAVELMIDQPSMIKRPLIQHQGKVLLGYNEQDLTDLFT